MGHGLHAHPVVKAIDLVGVAAAVGHDPTEAHLVVLGLGLNGRNDPIHRKDRIEVIRRDNQAVVGVLQRGRKSTTNHVAEHIKDHHIGVFQEMVLFQQLDRLSGDIAAAAGTRRRTAGLHALHPIEAIKDEVLWAQLLGVKVHPLEDVDHRRDHLLGQGEGAVVLRVAADLQHPFAELGEGRREVRAGGAFANPTFAVDGNDQRSLLDLHRGILMNLNAALTIGALERGGHKTRKTRNTGTLVLKLFFHTRPVPAP